MLLGFLIPCPGVASISLGCVWDILALCWHRGTFQLVDMIACIRVNWMALEDVKKLCQFVDDEGSNGKPNTLWFGNYGNDMKYAHQPAAKDLLELERFIKVVLPLLGAKPHLQQVRSFARKRNDLFAWAPSGHIGPKLVGLGL